MLAPFLFAGLLALSPIDFQAEDSAGIYTENISGLFQPGGMIAVNLRPGVTLSVDGIAVRQDDGLAVFGYDRDATGITELAFTLKGKTTTMQVPLAGREYDIQYIEGVAPKYVTPPPDVLARIRQEGKQKRNARAVSHARALFRERFEWPLTGRVTGVYGSQRYFNGAPRRPHYGLDIAAPIGTPVKAMAGGRVTLAEADMYYEGGLIFIDHGLDITSAYLHLSALDVKAGDQVSAGQVIGRVGSAGRSTGPHLDWRVYWRNRHLDPALLVAPLKP